MLPVSPQQSMHPGRSAEELTQAAVPNSRLLFAPDCLQAMGTLSRMLSRAGGSSSHLYPHIEFENYLLPSIRSSASSPIKKHRSGSASCDTVLQAQAKSQPSCLSFPFFKIRIILRDTSGWGVRRELNELFVKCSDYKYCYR